MARQTTSEFNQMVSRESVDVQMPDEKEPTVRKTKHTDNLAEKIDDELLDDLSSDLISKYESDKRSRSDWEDTIKKGIELLGLKLEETTKPFPGACAAHHPLMVEAAIQFQSQAIKELFPANGPVQTKMLGDYTEEKVKQSSRVKEFMNYQITDKMEEFFDDLDQMLFYLPIVGSCFKKIYYDEALKRPVARFIPVEDFVISYDTPDLRTSGRYTHVIRMEENELLKRQISGFYSEMDMEKDPDPSANKGDISDKLEEVQGRSRDIGSKDRIFTLLEMHIDMDLDDYKDEDGIAVPYIITICLDTKRVLSIRRNYNEDDDSKKRIQHFVHYKFLPGFGFYGLGYVHLLGNLQKSATTVLRSLIDAGQFANLPAGFKARGMRIEGGDQPIGFGEFKDVEGYGDDIKKSVVPLPFKEPSQVLTQLLGSMTEEGRRLAAITDLQTGDGNTQAPVGTTVALLEQGTKVMSSIHKRLHNSQKEELRILARINLDSLPDYYPYDVSGVSRYVFKKDFDGRVDVLPVSDPNIFSTAQRVILAQTQLQMAQSAPQIHDLREAYKRMYDALNIADVEDILMPEMGDKPKDPATENYAMLQARPVKAYPWQDHESHMGVHQAFMMDPSNVPPSQNPQQQQQMQMAMQQMITAHIAEHKAHLYRQMIERESGMELPTPPDYTRENMAKDDGYESMDPDMENQVARAQLQAAQVISQRNQALMQAQQNQQMNQDPRIQIMKEDLRLREQEQMANVQNDQQRNVLKAEEIRLKESEQRNQDEIDIMKINTDKEIAMQKMAVDSSSKTRAMRSQEIRDASRAKSNERIASKRETPKK